MAKNTPMSATFAGTMPFFVAELFRVALLLALPGLVFWLPRLLAE
jgi:TRAP-type C4-dicarboxylate transport system permease large subunit